MQLPGGRGSSLGEVNGKQHSHFHFNHNKLSPTHFNFCVRSRFGCELTLGRYTNCQMYFPAF
jgi:hypothetical protein